MKGSKHLVRTCPRCGGLLKAGKSPVIADSGFIYRERLCRVCKALVYTKQPPEEITGVERAGEMV